MEQNAFVFDGVRKKVVRQDKNLTQARPGREFQTQYMEICSGS